MVTTFDISERNLNFVGIVNSVVGSLQRKFLSDVEIRLNRNLSTNDSVRNPGSLQSGSVQEDLQQRRVDEVGTGDVGDVASDGKSEDFLGGRDEGWNGVESQLPSGEKKLGFMKRTWGNIPGVELAVLVGSPLEVGNSTCDFDGGRLGSSVGFQSNGGSSGGFTVEDGQSVSSLNSPLFEVDTDSGNSSAARGGLNSVVTLVLE